MKIERRKRRKKGRFLPAMFKFSSFCLAWFLVVHFFIGAEISIAYNKTKAQKARKSFWATTMKVVRGIGDVKRALF